MVTAADTRARWDVVLAVGVAVAQLLLVGIVASGPTGSPWRAPSVVTVVLILVQALPLAVRRRFPVPVLAVALAGNVTYYVLGYPPTGLDVATVVALYTVAAHRSGRIATSAFAVCAATVIVPFLGRWGPFWSRATIALVAYLVVFFAAGYAAGRYRRVRRLYNEEQMRLLRALAEQAQRERQVAEVLAVQAERTRIARELHDSVAHHLSVVAVQASAAAMQLDCDPDGARRALEAVRDAARQCLAAMPSIVRALRANDATARNAPDDGSWTPAATLADLPGVVDRLRGAGCPVQLRMDAMPQPLPPGVSESAFRVAQEALTNVVKHARGAAAAVAVTGGADGVTVEVTNNEPPEPVPAGPDSGHGFVGMRERVALFGGTFSAGPRPGGGFAVRAHFPTVAAPSEERTAS